MVRFYCDYCKKKAKELGIWHQHQVPVEITVDRLYRGIPGSESAKDTNYYSLAESKTLPPPPTLPSLPPPPPRVLHETRDDKLSVGKMLKTIN
ncbi:CYFA0S09e02322g1_1 [Cyberlindnera fabianii]|uniref:CYFA0S09e02322g1_1 n=1 Tax=Cyberlindnera fabianii TaxID=36022 RepID=A0A061AXJ3_CYBFA|nr:CYFA0S09e02322g1_1 [Cyberlindnera fabianii]